MSSAIRAGREIYDSKAAAAAKVIASIKSPWY